MDFIQRADEIEHELARYCVALNIDISDTVRLHQLAAHAVDKEYLTKVSIRAGHGDREAMSEMNLYGLIDLMFKTMTVSAEHGFETHGGPYWKAIAREVYKVIKD